MKVPHHFRGWIRPGRHVFRLLGIPTIAGIVTLQVAAAERISLETKAPASGLVVCQVDFTAAVRWCGMTVVPEKLQAWSVSSTNTLPSPFIPEQGEITKGTLILLCPANSAPLKIHLDFYGLTETPKGRLPRRT